MADAGLFQGQRVELLEGVIFRLPPQKNLHAVAVGLAEEVLRQAFGPGHWVRVQMPLHLLARSAPEPDLAVVPGTPRDYAASDHPSTAFLVVEVSDLSLSLDRGRKASLYARAAIGEYWIVNLVDRILEVRRRPARNAGSKYGHNYESEILLSSGDEVSPLALPQTCVPVAELLP